MMVYYIMKRKIDNAKKINAKKIATLVQKIEKCEDFLESLEGRSYNDEFAIYYRGMETCELEEEALNILINHYKTEREKLTKVLEQI